MKFDDKELKAERMRAIDRIDRSILEQPITAAFPDGEEELAALLTFLPEESRMPTLRAFVESMLQQ